MKHIFYTDPLEKLNLKKDSTLMLALNIQAQGIKTYLLFEKDLQWSNQHKSLKVYSFNGEMDGFYLKSFTLKEAHELSLKKNDILHMRLDPPFDGRYLRYLWLLDQWERQGIRVINSPRGIMQFNEKQLAYQQKGSVPSWVGESTESFSLFVAGLKAKRHKEIVLKPLDLYSGIGVEKWAIDDPKLLERMRMKAHELQGPIVAQAFMPEVVKGEIRALYFKGQHLGSILKKPKSGEFISNIAQGAAFEAIDLSKAVQDKCKVIYKELSKEGVWWVAFDILGKTPTEVNITCPGLLVEVSHAHQKNLADVIMNKI